MKKVKRLSGEYLKRMTIIRNILACAGLLTCIVLPILLSLVSTEITSQRISDIMMLAGVLIAFSSAVITAYIRYKNGASYALSVFCAFLIFSFAYQIMPHVLTFVLTLLMLCSAVFVLTFGAYNARSEKNVTVTYICTLLLCGVWFLLTCV